MAEWQPTNEDVCLYGGGQCHALAATIVSLRPGWRMVAVTARHVAAQAPDGRCLDIRGWGTWPNAREVTLEQLEFLRFMPPVFHQHTEDMARALLSALDPDCETFVR